MILWINLNELHKLLCNVGSKERHLAGGRELNEFSGKSLSLDGLWQELARWSFSYVSDSFSVLSVTAQRAI